jgi:HlyD family secretion protein
MWRSNVVRVSALGAILVTLSIWTLHTTSDVEVTTASVTTGPISRPIVATGTLQALTTVEVGTQVSGVVQSLEVDFNSIVHAGQVVARLDPSLYQAQLTEARANLAQAKADVGGLETTLEDARTKLSRAEELFKQHLIAQSDLDIAVVAVQQAEPDLRAGQSVVTQAQAAVDQASLDLEHTIIRSPIDGIIVERSVDVGQTLAASFQAPELFKIAADLTKMQVQVEVDESDVGGVAAGDLATFEVGSYPGAQFRGTVSEVRLQPITDQPSATTSATPSASSSGSTSPTPAAGTVVSYMAIVDVANQDERLRPGMTAEVSLGGFRREQAIRIPNNALSFRPPADVLEAIGERDTPLASLTSGRTTGASDGGQTREVWEYDGRRFTPIVVRGGLADDRWTELLSGSIRPGDRLVTSAVLQRRSRT